jgi:dolichol-phosphate mannosyltransferase
LYGKKAWSVFLSGFTSFSTLPIIVILLTGLFGTLLSTVALAVTLALFAFVVSMPAWPLWGAFGLWLWATLMLAMGTTGVFVGRAYKDVRGRPRYIVKEVLEFGSEWQREGPVAVDGSRWDFTADWER